MNPSERAVFQQSIANTLNLFKQKKMAEQWSQNIIDGSKLLTTPLQWKHFYCWLANPHGYNEKEVDSLPVDTEPPVIEPYAECMHVETFVNGNETQIHVTNTRFNDENDEKSTG